MSFANRAITLAIGLAMIGGSIGAAAARLRGSATIHGARRSTSAWQIKIGASIPSCATARSRPGAPARCTGRMRAIRHEERVMAGFNHSHLTPAEHRALNQQENAVSRQIGY